MPTDDYAIFSQADKWQISVRKLLTGEDGPLLNLEWKLWRRFRDAQFRLQKQQERAHGGRSGKRR